MLEQTRETGKEDKVKKSCRNIKTDAFQKEDNCDDAANFNWEILKYRVNDIKTKIFGLWDATNWKKILISDHMDKLQKIFNKYNKRIGGLRNVKLL
jgi:hypothetical protein